MPVDSPPAKFYRYEDHLVSTGYDYESDRSSGSRVELQLHEYHVIRKTPKGTWISVFGGAPFEDIRGSARFVLDEGRKRFAYETKEAALEGFIARKKRQIKILEARAREAREALERAEELRPVRPNAEWRVVLFDMNTLRGAARRGHELIHFSSTSFQSDTSHRWPRVGEKVEVAFTKDGDVLSIHGA